MARRDPIIRDLLDEFVCVRIVQANTIDLTRFQHDFDQSFAAYLMNPDLTIYGRFGTRSERPGARGHLAGGAPQGDGGGPADAPGLRGGSSRRWRASRSGRPATRRRGTTRACRASTARRSTTRARSAKSCMHCHQIREAERLVYRTAREPIPDEVLFPYPDPAVLGLKMDPKAMATVERVTPARSPSGPGCGPATRSRRWRGSRCCRSPTSSGSCTTPRPPRSCRPRSGGPARRWT